MAEETLKTAATEEVVVVPDAPVTKKAEDTVAVTEKELPPQPEAEAETKTAAAAEEKPPAGEEKITESGSFKEETNVVGELPDPQKVALEELKQLVEEALKKHEFSAPPPPPPAKEEEEPAETVAEEKAPEKAATGEEAKPEEAPATATEPVGVSEPAVEAKEEEKVTPPEPVAEPVTEPSEPVVVAEVVEKVETVVDEDGAKTVEAIEETIVAVAAATPTEEPTPAEPETPIPPEEVSIWGTPLLADERSDVVLLKFLRARDFKVKDAFTMLKKVVSWRKEFGIESLLEEDLGIEQEKVVYMHGVDKEGHPVCYNAIGEYQNKELYQNTFSDEEKRNKFLRWRIQFLEKSIRKLDFSPDGINTIVQVFDLKNSPGPFKWEIRQATNQALQLLQDNYPEFVAKQVFINVPWLYLAYYKMINSLFTQRSKSKLVFAGPSKSAETLFKYISPEQVPVQYGGLSKEGQFTTADPVTEEIIKPATKHTIEFPVSETCQLVWEARVVGWDVNYGAEFVPSTEGGYTIIVQKSRKVGSSDEPVVSSSFKIGEPGKVLLTFDNQSSKKKKLLYRSMTKPSSD